MQKTVDIPTSVEEWFQPVADDFVAGIRGPRNLTERVYTLLQTAIATRQLPPGQEVNEVMLAEKFATSVTPVRAAIDRLTGEGLIVRESSKPPRVASLTLKDIEDLYDVRRALEVLAISRAVHLATCADILSLRDLHRDAPRWAAEGRTEQYQDYNSRFHQKLQELSRNSLLEQMMRPLQTRFRLVAASTAAIQGVPQRSITEHGQMIDLIERRDADAAAALMATHIELAKHVYLQHYGSLVGRDQTGQSRSEKE